MNKLKGSPSPAPKLNRFTVCGELQNRQLLAWRERVGHVIDVIPSRAQVASPFSGVIDRYDLGNRFLTDCRTDSLTLERSVARISTDNQRDFGFHIFIAGGVDSVGKCATSRRAGHNPGSIFAFDLNQPLRMQRSACQLLALSVPRPVVEAVLPHAEAIHGRLFENTLPLTQLLVEHVTALARDLPGLSANQASSAFDTSMQLLLATLGKQAKLSGSARAAVRAAMFDKARRYVQANLHQATLSPESLVAALQLPRATLYRLFEHEGGLGAYIRHCRLREAADELVKFPNLPVMDIAYGLGFKSPQDFTRAFRRAYEMTPQDLRVNALQRLNNAPATRSNASVSGCLETAPMRTDSGT